jgi:hypothetical protein
MKRALNLMLVLGLVAAMVVSVGACGGDDDEATVGADASGEASGVPPDSAFQSLATALEPEGISVNPLPKASLKGAESGVAITGSKEGSARRFATKAEAQSYADEVAADGKKTSVLGTIVFEAATEADATFFADAFE